MSPFALHAFTLATTVAVELAIVLALAPRGRRSPVVRAALFANLASLPLANAALWPLDASWASAELGVFAFELVALRYAAPVTLGRAAALSAVANVASAALAIAVVL